LSAHSDHLTIPPLGLWQVKMHLIALSEIWGEAHSEDTLLLPRFSNRNVLQSVVNAKKRFGEEARYYYISDCLQCKVKGAHTISSIDEVSRDERASGIKVFICAFESDQKLIHVLRQIKEMPKAYYSMPVKGLPTARYYHTNDLAKKVLLEEIDKNRDLGHFDLADFENIIQAIERTQALQGDYVEIGVFRGRSAHVALNYMKQTRIARESYFFDTFEGFTYPMAKISSDAIWHETHKDTSIQKVSELLSCFPNIHIQKLNIIQDALPDEITEIAVCNIDVDMYEAIKAALEKIADLIVPGGIFIVEDIGHTPLLGGALLALEEFLKTKQANSFLPLHMSSGQTFLIKVR